MGVDRGVLRPVLPIEPRRRLGDFHGHQLLHVFLRSGHVALNISPLRAKPMPERRPVKVLHDGLHQPERSGGLCGASWSGLYRAQRRHHPATEPWPPSADAVKCKTLFMLARAAPAIIAFLA